MQLQVKLKGVPAASTLSGRIRRQLTKLEQRHPEVEGCRVMIERIPAAPERTERFAVSLDVGIGRRRVRVDGASNPDIGVALRDAFELAHTRLLDMAHRDVAPEMGDEKPSASEVTGAGRT